MPLPAGLLAGAGAVLSGGINSLFGGNQARKTRKANMRMAKWQHQKDTEAWERANEYNSPKNQMSRLTEAGLNPNLAYGSGSVVGNTSTQTPKQSVPDQSARGSLEMPNVMGMLSAYQDYKMKEVQINNLKTQGEVWNEDLNLKQLGSLLIHEKTLLTNSQTSKIDNTMGLQMQNLQEDIYKKQLQRGILKKDHDKYMESGVSPQAPWHAKMIEDLFQKYIIKNLK